MKPLRDFITQKYPQDQILEMFEATVLPRDPNNTPHHTVRIAITNNHLFVDQRIGKQRSTWEQNRFWLILCVSFFIAGTYVATQELGLYTAITVNALTLFSLWIGFKGDTILKAHKINIKKYPISQAVLERQGNHITLTINSTNSLKKEIDNYYYLNKPRRWSNFDEQYSQDNLYSDLATEKTSTGTKIVYQLQKNIDL
jgi:hypothetical protein